MNEFIKEFGKENIIIVLIVVVLIVIALIVIVLIEKIQRKRAILAEINNVTVKSDDQNIVKNSYVHEEDFGLEDNYLDDDIEEDSYLLKEEDFLEDEKNDSKNYDIKADNYDYIGDSDIFYEENSNSQEKAQEKLEEVTKKLVSEESDLIEHTHFENEQEEKSIISYEELLKASSDIDEKNDKLLADEGEAAITLDELYKLHEEEQDDEIEIVTHKVSNPVFVDEGRKFKNSEVISPVFGVYSGKVKGENDKSLDSFYNDNPRDIESEIEKTEEFLEELKKLRNKLE